MLKEVIKKAKTNEMKKVKESLYSYLTGQGTAEDSAVLWDFLKVLENELKD